MSEIGVGDIVEINYSSYSDASVIRIRGIVIKIDENNKVWSHWDRPMNSYLSWINKKDLEIIKKASYEIGDTVEVIDAAGSRRSKLHDICIIERVDKVRDSSDILEVTTTNRVINIHYGMRDYRFKIIKKISGGDSTVNKNSGKIMKERIEKLYA